MNRAACWLAGVLAAGSVAGTGMAQTSDAREFLEKAVKGDNSEMMLGQIAAERGSSPALRAYGRTLHSDHARAREETVPVAREAGAQISDEPMPEAAEERTKLDGLHGRAFDREFATYMVKDHRKDISDFEKQARKGGPAGRLAKQILPVLHKHLRMAERLTRG